MHITVSSLNVKTNIRKRALIKCALRLYRHMPFVFFFWLADHLLLITFRHSVAAHWFLMNRLEIKDKDNRHNRGKMDTYIFGLRAELHKHEKMSRKYENDGMEIYWQECFLKIKEINDSKDLIDRGVWRMKTTEISTNSDRAKDELMNVLKESNKEWKMRCFRVCKRENSVKSKKENQKEYWKVENWKKEWWQEYIFIIVWNNVRRKTRNEKQKLIWEA